MCSRIYVRQPLTELIQTLYPVGEEPGIGVGDVLSVTLADASAAPMAWGLIPTWIREGEEGARPVNARSETVVEKPYFRSAVRKRRCVVPIDGFYEYKKSRGMKLPHLIRRRDEAPLELAGIWEPSRSPDEPPTVCILTVPPNEVVKQVHNRMPAVLTNAEMKIWLDPDVPVSTAMQVVHPSECEPLELIPLALTRQVFDKPMSLGLD